MVVPLEYGSRLTAFLLLCYSAFSTASPEVKSSNKKIMRKSATNYVLVLLLLLKFIFVLCFGGNIAQQCHEVQVFMAVSSKQFQCHWLMRM